MTRGTFSLPLATVYVLMTEGEGGTSTVSVIFETADGFAFESFKAPTHREAWSALAAWVETKVTP